MKLDQTDRQLLMLLQEDAKINIELLQQKLNLSKTPIYERIKKLEREGYIEKYVAVLDHKKLDESMVVFCSVSLSSQKLEEIEAFSKAVLSIPEVAECYLMGGASDFLLKVVVRDLNAYHLFSSGKLAALKHVDQIKSTFVLDAVKRSTVIPI